MQLVRGRSSAGFALPGLFLDWSLLLAALAAIISITVIIISTIIAAALSVGCGDFNPLLLVLTMDQSEDVTQKKW